MSLCYNCGNTMEPGLRFCTECGSAAPRAPEPKPASPPSQWDSTLVLGAPPVPAYDDFAATEIAPALTPKSRKLPLIIVGVGVLVVSAAVLLLLFWPPSNKPPALKGIEASQLIVHTGDPVTLTASATDPNDDKLSYKWIASAGQVIGDGPSVTLSTTGVDASSGRSDIRVHVTVSDDHGESASADQTISVQPAIVANVEPPPTKLELNSNTSANPTLSSDANSTANANARRLVAQGTLRLFSSLDGTVLLIDDVPSGTLDAHRARVLRLSAGSHRVLAQKLGYKPWSRSVNLAGGRTETLSIDMERLGPTPDQVASQYLQRAERLRQQGNYDAGIAACDEGLRLAPGNSLLVQEREQIEKTKQRYLASLREEEERRKQEADEARKRQLAERFQPAVARKRVKPDYPAMARTAKINGTVIVEVTIDEQGYVSTAKAIEGPLILHQPAINAAKQWKFDPARRGGRAVADTTKIAFNFNL